MKVFARIFLLLACVTLLAMPHDADARAGSTRSSSGASMGSRGGHTYQSVPSYSASPIQRSVTPQPTPASPSYNNSGYGSGYSPGYASPYYGYGGHPFFSGLAGGFLGAGLAGMMFGHGLYGGMGYGGMNVFEYSPVGSLLGLGIQLFLLYLLGRWIFGWFRRGGLGAPMNFGNPADASFNAPPMMGAGPWGAAPALREAALNVTPEDYQQFQGLLEKIQLAWGQADLQHLRQYVTPEMLQYFSEQLSNNSSHGEVNRVSNVVMTEGTLAEAWSEADLDYATVHMKWNAIDFVARMDRQPTDADYVVSGDPAHPVEAQELWTFARARDGGNWLLSAIQQVR